MSSANHLCTQEALQFQPQSGGPILWLAFTCTDDTHGFEFTVKIDGSPAPGKRVAGGSRGGGNHLEELSKLAL